MKFLVHFQTNNYFPFCLWYFSVNCNVNYVLQRPASVKNLRRKWRNGKIARRKQLAKVSYPSCLPFLLVKELHRYI